MALPDGGLPCSGRRSDWLIPSRAASGEATAPRKPGGPVGRFTRGLDSGAQRRDARSEPRPERAVGAAYSHGSSDPLICQDGRALRPPVFAGLISRPRQLRLSIRKS